MSIGIGGCADVLDIPDEPRFEETGPWRCIDQSAHASEAPAATAKVSFRVCDFISGCTKILPGISGRLCDKLDVACLTPRSSVVISDANGIMTFDVPTPQGRPFDGYVEVRTPAAVCSDQNSFGDAAASLCQLLIPLGCDPVNPTEACYLPVYSPVLWFFNPAVVADLPEPIALQLYPSAHLPPLITAAGAEFDPSTASVFLTAWDCDGNPAPGVTLTVQEHEAAVEPLYYNTGVIRSDLDETDATGIGGFIRVPPGFVNVTGVNEEGKQVGIVGVQARVPFVTYTVLVPPSMQ